MCCARSRTRLRGRKSLCQGERRAQADVARRCADLDLEFTRIGGPRVFGRAPVRERRAIERELNGSSLAGLQLHAPKSLQLMHWPVDLRVAVMNIQLDHFGAGARARVADLETHLDRLAVRGPGGIDLQVAVFECRVTQAEAEWKLRFDVFRFEVA